MNFFEHQAQAHRQSLQLLLFFALAVLCIIAGVNFAVHFLTIFFFSANKLEHYQFLRWLPPQLYFYSTLATLMIISAGTFTRMAQLREGGSAVAKLMGGKRVARNTHDLLEQRLLNVVEEMAIASGIRIPALFIMHNEPAINAFAAGYSPNQAAIAVTRGCLEILNRDELQGVIAHEFSHILNGDIRINIRLMGVVHGILMIGILGSRLLHQKNSFRNMGSLALSLLGLTLYIIGYTGVFFGRLIKAALSRQREFLADASAVQFTRNPGGIAMALKKIHQHSNGSKLMNRRAEELSHMWFSEGLTHFSFSELFATHPPIKERIRRIQPGLQLITYKKGKEPIAQQQNDGLMQFLPPTANPRTDAATVFNSIGEINDTRIHYAHDLLQSIPASILELTRETQGAKAVLLSLLLGEQANEAIRILLKKQFPELWDTLQNVQQVQVLLLSHAHRIPLIDLSLHSLRTLPQAEKSLFLAQLKQLIDADQKNSLFEWVFFSIVSRQLGPRSERATKIRFHRLDQVLEPCLLILRLMANTGHGRHRADKEAAFNKGLSYLQLAPQELQETNIQLNDVKNALDDLHNLAVMPQMKIVKALVETALSDNQITTQEAELLRAVTEALDCPMPPVLSSLTA